jgi:hypothetical protein
MTVSILFFLTVLLVADNKIVLANHVRSIDNGFPDEMSQDNAFESSPRRLSHHGIHKIISSYDASTKAESVNPKLGSGLSEIIQGSESNQHVRKRLPVLTRYMLFITMHQCLMYTMRKNQRRSLIGSVNSTGDIARYLPTKLEQDFP